MELDELATRLASLESAQQEAQQAAQLESLMGTFGGMMGGDRSIGSEVLNQMAMRGVGAAAVGADQVVTEILSQIRQEAMALVDKINVVQDSVDAALGQESVPPEAMAPPPMDSGAVPPEAMAPPPMDSGAVPPEAMAPPLPPNIPSDKGVKVIKRPSQKVWKPSKTIVSALSGFRRV